MKNVLQRRLSKGFAAFLLVGFGIFLQASSASAVAWTDPFGGQTIQSGIGGIIRVIIGYVGILALLAFIYGGFLWMSAGGDAKKVALAKSVMVNTILGITIVFLSYAIVNFIVDSLGKATSVTS